MKIKTIRGVRTHDAGSPSYLARMPAGIPGAANRHSAGGLTITPEVQDEDLPVTAYGVPVKVSATGGMTPVKAGSADSDVYGVLVRPFPLQAVSTTGYSGAVDLGPASAVPPTQGTVDVLQKGFINVLLGGDTAAVKNGQVYIWIAATAGTSIQGGFVAAADGGNTILCPARFRGPADADGNVEIEYGIQPSLFT